MRFTVTSDDGADVGFECADTVASRWVCEEILAGKTYPRLPFVRDVAVVLDVGGNCGAASVYFARHYPNAQVHAFEPGSEQRAIFDRNAADYPNIRVHPFGLHSEDRSARLYAGDGDTITSSIFRRDINLDDYETIGLRSAAGWAEDNGIDRLDVVKLDVEGCEVDVLRSLVHLLPMLQVLYVEYDSRSARREIDALMSPTHELYQGFMFLDQGEVTYLRKDLAELPEAKPFQAELFRRRSESG